MSRLPGLGLEYLAIAYFKDFVSALLIDSEDRPVRISHEDEGRLIAEKDS